MKCASCTVSSTESIEDLSIEYEDDRNSMIAQAEKGMLKSTHMMNL